MAGMRNCRPSGAAEALSSPQPVGDGAKRSGLTGPRTAGQSVVVMAEAVATRSLSARTDIDERDARGGRQAGGDGRRPSQALIQCECAFNYMNAVSRQNLSIAFCSMETTRASSRDTRSTRGDITD